MKQIYHFEQMAPPVLTERQLRAELERRNLQRQTALLTIASSLMAATLLIWAIWLYPQMPILLVFCGSYGLVGMLGSAVITLAYVKKGEALWRRV